MRADYRIVILILICAAFLTFTTGPTLASSPQPTNIWDFSYSGSSAGAQGGYAIGNFQMHGPLYVRGNFQLSGSTQFFDGPIFVKSEESIPGLSGLGFTDQLSGDIFLDGSAQLGTNFTPISIFVESECPGCYIAPPCYCTATLGEPVPDIQLPQLSTADMLAMYMNSDLLYDPPVITSSGPRNAASMDGDQALTIQYGATLSFDHTFTDQSSDGLPSGTGHFKWDPSTNTLTVQGTVFIDGDLTLDGGSNQIIKYQGIGTLYVNGDVLLDNERFRASEVTDFPVTSDLGLVTPFTVNMLGNNCPACIGSDPAYQLAVFAGTTINVAKQTHLQGSLISGLLTFQQVPDIYATNLLSSNLPPDLPGADLTLDLVKPDTWITSVPASTSSTRDVTFTWSGSDDITASGDLTYSYLLSSADPEWSSYDTETLRTYSNLPNGTYTFKVRSRDEFGNVDNTAAEVTFAVDAPEKFRYEDTTSEIVYSPSCWSTYSNGLLSGGSAKISKKKACTATLNYTGSKVEFITARANKLGRAKVYIDSVLQGTLELYSSATTTQLNLYEYDHVVTGSHTIMVEVAGSKNIKSKDTWVPIDAFDVTN